MPRYNSKSSSRRPYMVQNSHQPNTAPPTVNEALFRDKRNATRALRKYRAVYDRLRSEYADVPEGSESRQSLGAQLREQEACVTEGKRLLRLTSEYVPDVHTGASNTSVETPMLMLRGCDIIHINNSGTMSDEKLTATVEDYALSAREAYRSFDPKISPLSESVERRISTINECRNTRFIRVRNVYDKGAELRKAADRLSAYMSKPPSISQNGELLLRANTALQKVPGLLREATEIYSYAGNVLDEWDLCASVPEKKDIYPEHLDLKSAVWWDKALSIGNELVGIASGRPELDWPTSRLGVDDNVTLHVSGRGKSRISEIGTIDLSKQPIGLEGYEKRVEGNLPTISGGSGSNAQFSE